MICHSNWSQLNAPHSATTRVWRVNKHGCQTAGSWTCVHSHLCQKIFKKKREQALIMSWRSRHAQCGLYLLQSKLKVSESDTFCEHFLCPISHLLCCHGLLTTCICSWVSDQCTLPHHIQSQLKKNKYVWFAPTEFGKGLFSSYTCQFESVPPHQSYRFLCQCAMPTVST